MSDWRLRELRGERRRTFLRMCGVVAAAVGIERAKLLDFLSGEGGYGVAEAAGKTYGRALIVPSPNGSHSWWTQLWPPPAGAAAALSSFASSAAYLYAPQHGHTSGYNGTNWKNGDRPFFYSPAAPWFDHALGKPKYPVTAILAGDDGEIHTTLPTSAVLNGGKSLLAIAAALGAASSTAPIPVMGISPIKLGMAPGAPPLVSAPSTAAFVDMFESASQYAIATEQDRILFTTYFEALQGLRKAAARTSYAPQLEVTRHAAKLLGLGYASQLATTDQDLAAYGVTAIETGAIAVGPIQRARLAAFGRALIFMSKAFRLGLVKTAIVPLSTGPIDNEYTDPHAAFVSPTSKLRARNTAGCIGSMLDAFYAELAKAPDPEDPSTTLDQTTVFVAYGDTPKNPFQSSGWPDNTPSSANWIYLMDPRGGVRNGWFGSVVPLDSSYGIAMGFDPATGLESGKLASHSTTSAGIKAVTHAIARGDKDMIDKFGLTGVKVDAMLKFG